MPILFNCALEKVRRESRRNKWTHFHMIQNQNGINYLLPSRTIKRYWQQAGEQQAEELYKHAGQNRIQNTPVKR